MAVAWPETGFVAANDSALSAAWVPSGPQLCGFGSPRVQNSSGCCNVTVLNCASNPLGRVYPDPSRPLEVPFIGCPAAASSPPMMLLFTGRGCPLLPETAPPGACYWNATGQVFAGLGCELKRTTGCACRHARSPPCWWLQWAQPPVFALNCLLRPSASLALSRSLSTVCRSFPPFFSAGT